MTSSIRHNVFRSIKEFSRERYTNVTNLNKYLREKILKIMTKAIDHKLIAFSFSKWYKKVILIKRLFDKIVRLRRIYRKDIFDLLLNYTRNRYYPRDCNKIIECDNISSLKFFINRILKIENDLKFKYLIIWIKNIRCYRKNHIIKMIEIIKRNIFRTLFIKEIEQKNSNFKIKNEIGNRNFKHLFKILDTKSKEINFYKWRNINYNFNKFTNIKKGILITKLIFMRIIFQSIYYHKNLIVWSRGYTINYKNKDVSDISNYNQSLNNLRKSINNNDENILSSYPKEEKTNNFNDRLKSISENEKNQNNFIYDMDDYRSKIIIDNNPVNNKKITYTIKNRIKIDNENVTNQFYDTDNINKINSDIELKEENSNKNKLNDRNDLNFGFEKIDINNQANIETSDEKYVDKKLIIKRKYYKEELNTYEVKEHDLKKDNSNTSILIEKDYNERINYNEDSNLVNQKKLKNYFNDKIIMSDNNDKEIQNNENLVKDNRTDKSIYHLKNKKYILNENESINNMKSKKLNYANSEYIFENSKLNKSNDIYHKDNYLIKNILNTDSINSESQFEDKLEVKEHYQIINKTIKKNIIVTEDNFSNIIIQDESLLNKPIDKEHFNNEKNCMYKNISHGDKTNIPESNLYDYKTIKLINKILNEKEFDDKSENGESNKISNSSIITNNISKDDNEIIQNKKIEKEYFELDSPVYGMVRNVKNNLDSGIIKISNILRKNIFKLLRNNIYIEYTDISNDNIEKTLRNNNRYLDNMYISKNDRNEYHDKFQSKTKDNYSYLKETKINIQKLYDKNAQDNKLHFNDKSKLDINIDYNHNKSYNDETINKERIIYFHVKNLNTKDNIDTETNQEIIRSNENTLNSIISENDNSSKIYTKKTKHIKSKSINDNIIQDKKINLDLPRDFSNLKKNISNEKDLKSYIIKKTKIEDDNITNKSHIIERKINLPLSRENLIERSPIGKKKIDIEDYNYSIKYQKKNDIENIIPIVDTKINNIIDKYKIEYDNHTSNDYSHESSKNKYNKNILNDNSTRKNNFSDSYENIINWENNTKIEKYFISNSINENQSIKSKEIENGENQSNRNEEIEHGENQSIKNINLNKIYERINDPNIISINKDYIINTFNKIDYVKPQFIKDTIERDKDRYNDKNITKTNKDEYICMNFEDKNKLEKINDPYNLLISFNTKQFKNNNSDEENRDKTSIEIKDEYSYINSDKYSNDKNMNHVKTIAISKFFNNDKTIIDDLSKINNYNKIITKDNKSKIVEKDNIENDKSQSINNIYSEDKEISYSNESNKSTKKNEILLKTRTIKNITEDIRNKDNTKNIHFISDHYSKNKKDLSYNLNYSNEFGNDDDCIKVNNISQEKKIYDMSYDKNIHLLENNDNKIYSIDQNYPEIKSIKLKTGIIKTYKNEDNKIIKDDNFNFIYKNRDNYETHDDINKSENLQDLYINEDKLNKENKTYSEIKSLSIDDDYKKKLNVEKELSDNKQIYISDIITNYNNKYNLIENVNDKLKPIINNNYIHNDNTSSNEESNLIKNTQNHEDSYDEYIKLFKPKIWTNYKDYTNSNINHNKLIKNMNINKYNTNKDDLYDKPEKTYNYLNEGETYIKKSILKKGYRNSDKSTDYDNYKHISIRENISEKEIINNNILSIFNEYYFLKIKKLLFGLDGFTNFISVNYMTRGKYNIIKHIIKKKIENNNMSIRYVIFKWKSHNIDFYNKKSKIIQDYIRYKLNLIKRNEKLTNIVLKYYSDTRNFNKYCFQNWRKLSFMNNILKNAKTIQKFCRIVLSHRILNNIFFKYLMKKISISIYNTSKIIALKWIFLKHLKNSFYKIKYITKINLLKTILRFKYDRSMFQIFEKWRITSRLKKIKFKYSLKLIQKIWRRYKVIQILTRNQNLKILIHKYNKDIKLIKLNYLKQWQKKIRILDLHNNSIIIQNFIRSKRKKTFFLYKHNLFLYLLDKLKKEVQRRLFINFLLILKNKYIYYFKRAFKKIKHYGRKKYKKIVISVCKIQSFYKIWKCKREILKEIKISLIKRQYDDKEIFYHLFKNYIYIRCFKDLKIFNIAENIRKKL